MQTKINSGGNRPFPRTIRGLTHFLRLLEAKNLEDNIKQEVIQEVKKYPEGSLNYAWTNIENMIQNAAQRCAKKKAE